MPRQKKEAAAPPVEKKPSVRRRGTKTSVSDKVTTPPAAAAAALPTRSSSRNLLAPYLAYRLAKENNNNKLPTKVEEPVVVLEPPKPKPKPLRRRPSKVAAAAVVVKQELENKPLPPPPPPAAVDVVVSKPTSNKRPTKPTGRTVVDKKQPAHIITLEEFERQLETARQSAMPEAEQLRQLVAKQDLGDETVPEDTFYGLPSALRFPTRRTVDNDTLEYFFSKQHFTQLMNHIMGLVKEQAEDPSCYVRSYMQVHVTDNTTEPGQLPKIDVKSATQFAKLVKKCKSSIMLVPIYTSIGSTETENKDEHANMLIFDKESKTVQWIDPHGNEAGSHHGARWATGLMNADNRKNLPADLQEQLAIHITTYSSAAQVAFIVLKYHMQTEVLPLFGKGWMMEYEPACPLQTMHVQRNHEIGRRLHDFATGGGICVLFAAMTALIAVRVRGNIVQAQRSLVKWMKASKSNSLFLSLAFVKNVLESMSDITYTTFIKVLKARDEGKNPVLAMLS